MGTRSELAVSSRVLLAALRWRWPAETLLFLVATAAVAAAAIGPLFVGAANQSVFVSTFRSAPAGSADLVIISDGHDAARRRLSAAASAVVRLGGGLLDPPLTTADLGFKFSGAGGQFYGTDLLSRTAICSHVAFVRGSCPTRTGDVAVSARSAAAAAIGLGATVPVGSSRVRIVGVYDPPSSTSGAYWLGNDYFAYGTGSGTTVQLDPLLATETTVLTARAPSTPQLSAAIPWATASVSHGPGRLETTLRRAQALLASGYGLSASSRLPSIAAATAHVEHLMHEIVLTVELQVVLLALLVLYFLGRSTAAGRAAELELARRRGFPRRAVVEFALAEPAAMILLSLPAGLVVAWGTVALLAPHLFTAGVGVSLGGEAIGAAAVCALAALVATAAATHAYWRSSRIVRGRRDGRAAIAAETAAVVLALAGLTVLGTGGELRGSHADPFASLAPGLLAIGAGVLGLRLAVLLARLALRSTAGSSHVAWFLAVRQVARRPSAMRQLLPLTATTALVLFAVGAYSLAASNRARVADFQVGAERVVDVSPSPGVDLENAVRRADPSGRRAMAAALYESPSSELLAVDAARLAAVAAWPRELSRDPIETLAARLDPPVPPGIVVRGDRLRLEITVGRVPSIVVTATLFDELSQSEETVTFGPLHAGTREYDAGLLGACSLRCRLLSLSPAWHGLNVSYARPVELTLDGIATRTGRGPWRPVRLGGGRRPSWTATPRSLSVAGGSAAGGVRFRIPGSLLAYGGLLLRPVDAPAALPAVVTTRFLALDPLGPGQTSVETQGLDGGPLGIAPFETVAALSLAGEDAGLVDLRLAERMQTGPAIATTYQVWLSPSAGPAVLDRLRRLGVRVGPVTRASTVKALLDKGGPALAYDLALIVTPVALLLALGTVGFGIVSEGRVRQRELATLKLSGIDARVARRALLLENGVVLATVIVLGGLIGFAAAALALPSLPEFAGGTGGVPIATGTPIGPTLAALGVVAAVLAVTTALSTALVTRSEPSAPDGSGLA